MLRPPAVESGAGRQRRAGLRLGDRAASGLALLLVLTLGGCSEQARARRELRRQGIPFTPAELTSRVKAQDLPIVEALLHAGICEDRDACTAALCVAVRLPDARIVTALAGAGADVQSQQGSLEDYPVLMQAAEAGQAANVVALAKMGADPNATAGLQLHKMTALHVAAARGDLTTIEALFSVGAKPDALADWMGDRVAPLHLAAARGDVATMDALIGGGADPDQPSLNGITPARAAVDNDRDAAAAHLDGLAGATPPAHGSRP